MISKKKKKETRVYQLLDKERDGRKEIAIGSGKKAESCAISALPGKHITTDPRSGVYARARARTRTDVHAA